MSVLQRRPTEASELGNLAERITRLESKFDNIAPRTWVLEVLKPVEQSISRMEQTVSRLADESKILFSFHEQLLKERAEHERLESEAKLQAIHEQHAQAMKAAQDAAASAEARAASAGALHWIEKKASPVVSFLSTVIGIVIIGGGLFAWWITNYVLPLSKAAGH